MLKILISCNSYEQGLTPPLPGKALVVFKKNHKIAYLLAGLFKKNHKIVEIWLESSYPHPPSQK